MIKGTHCMESGAYYYEVKITKTEAKSKNENLPSYAKESHFRLGWCLEEADDKAPCGFDKLSYSYGSKTGCVYHKSEALPYGEAFGEIGDVIGCYIEIPKRTGPMKLKRTPSSYYDYRTGEKYKMLIEGLDEEVAEGSKIIFFKNGKYQGVAFSNINFGAYYPAVSLYMNACVTVAFESNQLQYNPYNSYPDMISKNWKAIGELRHKTVPKKPSAPKKTEPKSQTSTNNIMPPPNPKKKATAAFRDMMKGNDVIMEAARKLHSLPSSVRKSKVASAVVSTSDHTAPSQKPKKTKEKKPKDQSIEQPKKKKEKGNSVQPETNQPKLDIPQSSRNEAIIENNSWPSEEKPSTQPVVAPVVEPTKKEKKERKEKNRK